MDVVVSVNLDVFFGTSVTPLYREKRRLRSQLITLVLVSFGYCTSVGFRNAVSGSYLALTTVLSETQHTTDYQAYHSQHSHRTDGGIARNVVISLWIYALSITFVAMSVVLVLSIVIGRANASHYVEKYHAAFTHWTDEKKNLKKEEKTEEQKIVKKKLWLDSVVLERVWGDTFASVRSKTLQILTACLAFSTGWAWKDAISGLIVYAYTNGIARLISLWIYTISVMLITLFLTGAIYREFNNMAMALRRNLEAYRSWAENNPEAAAKEAEEAAKAEMKDATDVEIVLQQELQMAELNNKTRASVSRSAEDENEDEQKEEQKKKKEKEEEKEKDKNQSQVQKKRY